MDSQILSVSERGQVTIPKNFRDKVQVKHFIFEIKDDSITLKPLKTKEDFFAELENAEKDWKKNGGLTIKDIKKKYKVK